MTEHVKIYGVVPKKQYVADGTLTTFEFPFAIFNESDIEVYLNDTKQSNTTYTVSGVRDSDGGSITFTTAPTASTIITIMRHLSIERQSDFQEGGALRADTLNDELDYQIACQQQIAENLNRSMVLPPYAVNDDVDLTLPTPSAGKAIVWNADGTNLENSTVAVNALESTLKGYKETAESAASTATTKAGIASDKADIATSKAAEATEATGNKANKDLDNLTTTGKTCVAHLSMPSDTCVDLTLDANNSTYTAPADGYILFVRASTANSYAHTVLGVLKDGETTISDSTIEYRSGDATSTNGAVMEVMVPVLKDKTFTTMYGGSANTLYFRFIYAQGEA